MINLRTLVVGTLLFCIVVVSGCFGNDAPTTPEPAPTPTLPPAPTATATPLPSFGPFIPLGEPVHRNLGTSTEVVRNCVPGAVDPIVKTPSRSLIASHNVEWSVAGTAGIGTSIGGGVLPVEVNLDVSLTTTYGQGYSETTERGTGWQLPAKPNTIVTYILAWGEKWQPGFVEVRLWNQPVIKIDVFYRTDVTSEIVAEDAQDCDGTRTEEPVPADTPIPLNTPLTSATTLLPSSTSSSSDEAPFTPEPLRLSFSVPGDMENGIQINIQTTGFYVLKYDGNAYSPWADDTVEGNKGWATHIQVFINRPVEWGLTEYNLIGPVNFDAYLGASGYYVMKDAAVSATQDRSVSIGHLNTTDYITFVVVDEQGRYFDNRGQVNLLLELIAP